MESKVDLDSSLKVEFSIIFDPSSSQQLIWILKASFNYRGRKSKINCAFARLAIWLGSQNPESLRKISTLQQSGSEIKNQLCFCKAGNLTWVTNPKISLQNQRKSRWLSFWTNVFCSFPAINTSRMESSPTIALLYCFLWFILAQSLLDSSNKCPSINCQHLPKDFTGSGEE